MQARGELVAFENAVSIGTRTMVSVPYMLHGIQGIDPTGWIYRTPSVFNYASSAGSQTGNNPCFYRCQPEGRRGEDDNSGQYCGGAGGLRGARTGD